MPSVAAVGDMGMAQEGMFVMGELVVVRRAAQCPDVQKGVTYRSKDNEVRVSCHTQHHLDNQKCWNELRIRGLTKAFA